MTRRLYFIFIACLILVGCQPESTSPQTGNSLTPAVQHLNHDVKSDQPLDSGHLLVRITPSPLTSRDNAKAIFLNCKQTVVYQWFLNDEKIYGETAQSLIGSNYNRDDSVTVIARCGENSVNSNAVVQNTPPAISEIKFKNPLIIAGKSITVTPIATDHDQDLIDFSYEWTVENNLLDDISDASLPGEYIHKGTNISLAVTPFDGYEYGATFQGLNLIVPNSPPKVTSTPPPLTSDQYTYNVNANDPDHDKLTFQIAQGPKGMIIHSESGQLTWDIAPDTQPGTYDIEIIAEDTEGAQSRQFFSLSLAYPE